MSAPSPGRGIFGSGPPLTPGLWLGLLLVACAYLYRLDSLEIPGIGDEMYYIQIARVTAAQGRLLPLVSQQGLADTKPPLLFWQGILLTGWGKHWDLWHLRLPIVVYSFLTALVAGFLAARLGRSRRTGVLAALVYLGCWSTFQQGRPFLVNAPETLFEFLPLVLLLQAGELTWPVALLSGTALGFASLYKSCVLIVPAVAALAWILWFRRRHDLLAFLRKDAPKLLAMSGLGLALFGLWFVFDPFPGVIVRTFLVGENLAKLRMTDYVGGLLTGNYPLWHIWLGDLWNAGFYVFPLLGLAWSALRRLRSGVPENRLTPAEAELWRYVIAFLVVYSVPSQRQENYLLPTMPALAVLLALSWERIPDWFHRLSAALVIGALALVLVLMRGLAQAVPAAAHPGTAFAAMALVSVIALVAISSGTRARALLPAAVAGAWLSIAILVGPFDQPLRSAAPGPGLAALAGRTVYFPALFNAWEERYRFLAPECEVRGYDARTRGQAEELLAQGKPTAVWEALHAEADTGFVRYADRLELQHRLSNDAIAALVFHGRYDLWVRRLVIREKRAAPRQGNPRPSD